MSKHPSAKDRITGRATFVNLKPAEHEIYSRVPGPLTIELRQVTRYQYEAYVVNPKTFVKAHPLRNLAGVDIRGPIQRAMREVAERFEEMANPWTFRLGENVIGCPPEK